LAGAVSKDLATQTGANSLVEQLRRRGHRGRHFDHDGGSGSGVAAGIIGSLFLGAIIVNEAQRQQAIEYCARRYRTFNPDSMTYMGCDGYPHPCP
jgi:hypothetical protein